MNMASIVFLLVVLTACYYSPGNANNAFIKVECNSENKGQYGQQSVLNCAIQTGKNVADVKIIIVTWKNTIDDEPLLVYNKGQTKKQPGYSFAEPSWNDRNMNVSLLISNTAVKNEGSYECMVMTDSGYDTQQTVLKVEAKYNAPTINPSPESIDRNTEGTLTCKSDGGYPEGKIRWFDELNGDWTASSKMTVTKTKEGLFQLSSTLTLLRGSIFPKYTCAVYNASGGQEYETVFEIPEDLQKRTGNGSEPGNPSSKVVAPIVVIGSLIVGLLILMVYYHRRRVQQTRRQSATPLMGDRQEVPTCESDAEGGNIPEMKETRKDSMA